MYVHRTIHKNTQMKSKNRPPKSNIVFNNKNCKTYRH